MMTHFFYSTDTVQQRPLSNYAFDLCYSFSCMLFLDNETFKLNEMGCIFLMFLQYYSFLKQHTNDVEKSMQ